MRTEIQILMIGVGGALGAISRFGIAEISKRFLPESLPFGTLIANPDWLFLNRTNYWKWAFGKKRVNSVRVRNWFSGALTTFSTFGAETFGHISEGNLTDRLWKCGRSM